MLVVGITSRALFDLDSSHALFQSEGLEVYAQHQIENENVPLKPGKAFSMVKKLLNLNSLIEGSRSVEVILLSRNSADTGLRIFNSIEHHDLDITRAAFSGGNSPHEYAKAFGVHLFLSSEYADCKLALENGIASARIMPSGKSEIMNGILKVAFDGDAVIFSDESQEIFEKEGLIAFDKNEKSLAKYPLSGGPFKPFLSKLNIIQNNFKYYDCPVRIALVTARSAPSHERVIRTLRDWNIRIDECLFLGGLTKKDFLKAYQADIFCDDQLENCELSSEEVPTGQVVRLKS